MVHRPVPKTALVLAGGKGERLRPLTDNRPKPMVELAGAPILVHHLRWLRRNGIERAILLTGYLHEEVEAYFVVPRIEGLTVTCVSEDRPLGRGGVLKNGFVQAGIPDQVVVATNGDVLTDQSLGELFELHVQSNALVTLMLTRMASPYGTVDVDDDGMVSRFNDRPVLPYWINAGVYRIDTSVFAQFPDEGDHETTTFPLLADDGRLVGLRSRSQSMSVESADDLRRVGEWLATGLHPSGSQ